MLKVHVCHSLLPDAGDAAAELIDGCRKQLGDAPPVAALLFVSSDMSGETILQATRKAFPEVSLIGCTTSGEVTSAEGFCEGSAVLTVFSGEDVEVHAGVGRGTAADSASAGAEAAKSALAEANLSPCFCLIFPDGLTSNCTAVVDGVKSVLGDDFPIFGGAAADDWKFEQTKQFCGEETLTDSAPLLLFCGDIKFAFGCSHGWTPFTKRVEVTRAEGNVVYAFDDRPALEMYRHYVGTDASPSAEYPLAVFADRDSQDFYLRAGMAFDPEAGSISFAGDVPQSSWVQISKTDRNSIIKACETSLEAATSNFKTADLKAALVFSCAARKEQLGTRTALEAKALDERLPADTPMAGFYCYAEITPLARDRPTFVHNETFVALLLGG